VSAEATSAVTSWIVDIRALDEAALADDRVLREFYDVTRRAELLGRPDSPYWEFEEFLGAIRSPDSGERQDLLAAYDDGRIVGTAMTWSFLFDNLDKVAFGVAVDVTERRRGVGRALVERIERAAKDDGRSLMMTDTKLPFDDRENHAYRRFAETCGYQLSDFEVVRHLPLPVPDELIQDWIDDAAPHHADYRIETFVGAVPDDLVESLCTLLGQLAVDAPTGLVDFEEETVTRQRYDEMLATAAAQHRARYETVALTADRQVVAQSTLVMSLRGSTTVQQWGTLVHREHRGHRLGLATKATNLRAVQAARSDLTRVTTQNGETNSYMVAINERMGFRPIEVSAEFVKRI
jgi:GNAT superfamily N-acetyltransferase